MLDMFSFGAKRTSGGDDAEEGGGKRSAGPGFSFGGKSEPAGAGPSRTLASGAGCIAIADGAGGCHSHCALQGR